MADQSTVDVSGWEQGLAKLSDPSLRQSLARSMAVAGGKVLRDEAKQLAPKDSGRLSVSIYLAFKDSESSPERVVYSVTWNKKLAPHGHLIEFGHWQTHVAYLKDDGTWTTDPNRKLRNPKWIAAHPFLRPASENASQAAQTAMVRRGAERLPELLAGARDEA